MTATLDTLLSGLPSHSSPEAFLAPLSLLLGSFFLYLAFKPGGRFYFGKFGKSKTEPSMPNWVGRLVFALAGLGSFSIFFLVVTSDGRRLGFLPELVKITVYVIWVLVGLAWLHKIMQSR